MIAVEFLSPYHQDNPKYLVAGLELRGSEWVFVVEDALHLNEWITPDLNGGGNYSSVLALGKYLFPNAKTDADALKKAALFLKEAGELARRLSGPKGLDFENEALGALAKSLLWTASGAREEARDLGESTYIPPVDLPDYTAATATKG